MSLKKIRAALLFFVISVVSISSQVNSDEYKISWERSGYYYNDLAIVKILCPESFDFPVSAKIEVCSNPPVGKSRIFYEEDLLLKKSNEEIKIKIRFNLKDYILEEEAEAAVAEMNIENPEERENMKRELIPGGYYEQNYFLKLYITENLVAQSSNTLIIASDRFY